MPEHKTHKFRWMTLSGVFVCRPIDADSNCVKIFDPALASIGRHSLTQNYVIQRTLWVNRIEVNRKKFV